MHFLSGRISNNAIIETNFVILKKFSLKNNQLYNYVSIVTDHCDTKSTRCGENLSAGSTGGCYRKDIVEEEGGLIATYFIDDALE